MPDVPFSVDVVPASARGRTRVVVVGELDIATSPVLAEVLREQLASAQVVLDLAGVQFMDSSGVRVIDRVLRDCDAQAMDLVVDPNLPPPVTQVLEMTGMLGVLPMAGDA